MSIPVRAGYVAIIGLPNVGKSTLLNRLLKVKLSIVSRKPQTTRNQIIGILTEGDAQAVFVDTPGVITPKYEVHSMMMKAIREALAGADIVLWLTDVDTAVSGDELVKKLLPRGTRLLAINKIDRAANKNELLPKIDHYQKMGFDEVFLISALGGEGLDELKRAILARLPEGTFFFPEDQLTEHPERFFVGELIREQIFDAYGEEIPYASFVTVEEFKERDLGKYYIRAVVHVEKDSQKSIIIGRKGAALKRLGTKARKAIELFLEHEVFLDLWVKVKQNWRRRRDVLGQIDAGNV